ncbi:hypothetical protein [Draconibacterium mangrovi]|uniref:hypothetical protein n=1 Tax=Draconibacterium mangrovi TaxID=2697469 RepID=UPI0013D14210|nr:hypothetical protein [Draconibacterium mangrovi]
MQLANPAQQKKFAEIFRQVQLDKESEKAEHLYKQMEQMELESIKKVGDYFDRIHDKLYTLNNIIIAGLLVLFTLNNEEFFIFWFLIPPVFNLLYLAYIDYRMMQLNRKWAKATELEPDEIHKLQETVDNNNLHSLISVFITVLVLGAFAAAFIMLYTPPV